MKFCVNCQNQSFRSLLTRSLTFARSQTHSDTNSHVVGGGRGLVGIFGTHQPLARPLPSSIGGQGLSPRSRTRKRPKPLPPSPGLPPPHPRYKPVTINQSRDNHQITKDRDNLQKYVYRRGRSVAVHSGLAGCPTYPPCAPTPLQKRCLVVLRTTKRVCRLPLTDAPSTKCVTINTPRGSLMARPYGAVLYFVRSRSVVVC